jgi:hypothetical protein
VNVRDESAVLGPDITISELEENCRQVDPLVAAALRGRGVAGIQVDALVAAAPSRSRGVAGETERASKGQVGEHDQSMEVPQELDMEVEESVPDQNSSLSVHDLDLKVPANQCLSVTPGAGTPGRRDRRAASELACEVGQKFEAGREKGASIALVEGAACVVASETQGNLSRLRAGKRQVGLADRASSVHGVPGHEFKAATPHDPPKRFLDEQKRQKGMTKDIDHWAPVYHPEAASSSGKSVNLTVDSGTRENHASRECSNGDTSDTLGSKRAPDGHGPTGHVPVYRTCLGSHPLKAASGHRPGCTEGDGDRRSAECQDLGAPSTLTARALPQEAPQRSSFQNHPPSTPPRGLRKKQMTC